MLVTLKFPQKQTIACHQNLSTSPLRIKETREPFDTNWITRSAPW